VNDPRIADALARLPDYLGNHIRVSVIALALGLAVSIPLAFVCVHRPTLRAIALALTSIVQTIPGLALLALFYPLLLAAAALSERMIGMSFSALGLLPSVLALALYSMLPVLRNTITGLMGIDPAIKEAALGVGMTRRESLIMVEWPLALPVIMAGIRTAAVWVIGTATLATPIGQTSLGNYIFTGLQTQNWVFVIVGCVAAAVLALAVDQLLALIERGVSQRKQAHVAAGIVGVLAIAVLAFLPNFARGGSTYVIGAKPFAEQYILGALIDQRLAARGLPASRRDGLGSAVVFDALAAGDIDVYVEYTGTIWTNVMKRSDVKPRAEVLAEVGRWLEATHRITLVGGLGFENAYALAVTRVRADELRLRTVGDLARHAPQLAIAGDYEFFGRPEWQALRSAYGLAFRAQRTMQPEFMYPAVAAGDIDVISAYTSDGRVAQFGLRVLDDDKHAIPPYDAVLLVSPKRANDTALLDALRPLVGVLNVEMMREANRKAQAETPEEIARWLWEKIGR
jgi:osmoprotectant transport system permease protein